MATSYYKIFGRAPIQYLSSIRTMENKLPVLFLSHGGGPCFFMDGEDQPTFGELDKHSRSAEFLRSVGKTYGKDVKTILVISAHWEASTFEVSYQRGSTPLIYDYYGFPEETYSPHLVYPVGTDLKVADRVCELLAASNLTCRKTDRGFDHGVFIPLKLAFPEANVPVVQLSLKSDLDIATHVRLGEALSPLRGEGVLIIGSGQVTHNLRDLGQPYGPVLPWATEFTEWLRRTLEDVARKDFAASKKALLNIMTEAPHAKRCHPRIEHLLPLHVAFGAASPLAPAESDAGSNTLAVERIYSQIVIGTMSLDSYAFH